VKSGNTDVTDIREFSYVISR